MGNKIVKPIPLFNLAASRRTATTNIPKKRPIERWSFFEIFLLGVVILTYPSSPIATAISNEPVTGNRQTL